MKKSRNRETVWKRIRKNLKIEFYARGITRCEYPECDSEFALGFAHRHPRSFYYNRDREVEEEMLGSFSEVLLLCAKHHAILDDRSKTSEEEKEDLFDELREEYLV